jgi:hypothetical protein
MMTARRMRTMTPTTPPTIAAVGDPPVWASTRFKKKKRSHRHHFFKKIPNFKVAWLLCTENSTTTHKFISLYNKLVINTMYSFVNENCLGPTTFYMPQSMHSSVTVSQIKPENFVLRGEWKYPNYPLIFHYARAQGLEGGWVSGGGVLPLFTYTYCP